MVDTPAVVHAGAGTPAVGNALHAAAAAAPSQQQQIMLLVPYRSDAPVAATHERDSESFPLILSGMDSLRPEEQRTCPIVLEEFDKVGDVFLCAVRPPVSVLAGGINPHVDDVFQQATVDFLPEGSCFVEGKPELCIGTLPCGHRFHALALVCHMAFCSMTCPICR
jgi:hypothetical protein